MTAIKRSYLIGSQWVYYKIYTGPKTADLLLTAYIKPIADKLLKSKKIEKWFFIRNEDPKFHLRVRFLVSKPAYIENVIREIYTASRPFFNEDLLWKIQLDTYHREIERYGELTMSASETLFFHDSELSVNLVNLIDNDDEGDELRWLFAIRTIDTFLTNFSYSEDEKCDLLERLKVGFCNEFYMNNFLRKQLEKKYRLHQEKISDFLLLTKENASEYKPLLAIIDKKSTQNIIAIKKIKKLIKKEDLNSYLESQIHMIMNRIFRSKNRLHELVIYFFMYKHYKILWSKRNYKNKIGIN